MDDASLMKEMHIMVSIYQKKVSAWIQLKMDICISRYRSKHVFVLSKISSKMNIIKAFEAKHYFIFETKWVKYREKDKRLLLSLVKYNI